MDTFWPHTIWYLCILFERLLNPMLTEGILIFLTLCFRKTWYIRNILWKPNGLKTAVNSKEIKSLIHFLNLSKFSCWNNNSLIQKLACFYSLFPHFFCPSSIPILFLNNDSILKNIGFKVIFYDLESHKHVIKIQFLISFYHVSYLVLFYEYFSTERQRKNSHTSILPLIKG